VGGGPRGDAGVLEPAQRALELQTLAGLLRGLELGLLQLAEAALELGSPVVKLRLLN